MPEGKRPRKTTWRSLREWGWAIECWCDSTKHRQLSGCPRTDFYRDVRQLERASLRSRP